MTATSPYESQRYGASDSSCAGLASWCGDYGKPRQAAAKVSGAVAALDATRWDWFGLAANGGSRRDEMSICNGTKHSIELVKWYVYGGKVKVPPEPYIQPMKQDDCLFHKTGSWAAIGSSGIVTYRLHHKTNLHILWDCPFNFDHYDNYIGLMLTSGTDRFIPDKNLFRLWSSTRTQWQ